MTITLTREEAKQVLDVLNDVRYRIEFGQMNLSDDTDAAIDTLRTRLAQPEPEPVAWMHIPHDDNLETVITKHKRSLKIYKSYVPLYTTPPQRDFKFSTTEEAKQPAPTPKKEPQLTDDEVQFAHAFTALLKSGYGKEAEIVLKSKKREWQGLTDEEIDKALWENESNYLPDIIRIAEAKLKEKNG
jgi:hypothetical protein